MSEKLTTKTKMLGFAFTISNLLMLAMLALIGLFGGTMAINGADAYDTMPQVTVKQASFASDGTLKGKTGNQEYALKIMDKRPTITNGEATVWANGADGWAFATKQAMLDATTGKKKQDENRLAIFTKLFIAFVVLTIGIDVLSGGKAKKMFIESIVSAPADKKSLR